MRFKLFVACALACGFMAYVLANENVSTEVEELFIKAVPANKAPKIAQAAEFVDIPEEPKKPPAVKKVEKMSPPATAPASAPVSAPASAPAAAKLSPQAKPAVKEAVVPQKLVLPVASSSRGTDDTLTVAGLKPQPKSGALVMPFEYLGELYDVDNSGYNWGKCKSRSIER